MLDFLKFKRSVDFIDMKKLFAFAICLCMISVLPGCEPKHPPDNPKTDFPVTVGDLVIRSAPQKVVSLSPSITEIIYSLGSYARLIGVSDYCDFPPEIEALPKLGNQILPDIDAIIALGADLVLCSGELPAGDLERLQAQKINVIIVSPGVDADLFELFNAVSSVLSGYLTGEATARRAAGLVNAEYDRVAEAVPAASAKACLFLSASGDVATPDTFAGQLLEKARAVNAAQGGSNFSFPIEELASQMPEFIFCPKTDVEAYKSNPALAEAPAVQKGQVIGVDTVLFERQGERAAEAVKTLAALMYPEQASYLLTVSDQPGH